MIEYNIIVNITCKGKFPIACFGLKITLVNKLLFYERL